MNKKDQAYNNLTKTEQRLVAELDNIGGVLYIRQWVDSQKNEYPKKPIKPRLESPVGDLLSTSAQIYLNACLTYDEENHKYQIAMEKYRTKQQEIDNALMFFVKDQSGFFNIPVIYQDSTWSKAWRDGHANGWDSVYNELCELVEIFENKL